MKGLPSAHQGVPVQVKYSQHLSDCRLTDRLGREIQQIFQQPPDLEDPHALKPACYTQQCPYCLSPHTGRAFRRHEESRVWQRELTSFVQVAVQKNASVNFIKS